MPSKIGRAKQFVYGAVISCLTFFLCIAGIEVWLRQASFSSGTGGGQAAQRWFKENWKPINSLGYRDLEIDSSSKNASLVFLGDSFTAGHGVKFEETYADKLRQKLDTKRVVNLGQPGAGTQRETVNFQAFTEKYGTNIDVVVLQYFGNDIDDYFPKDYLTKKIGKANRSGISGWIIRHSEVANIINSYFFLQSFGEEYLNDLFSAYRDPDTLGKHLADLKGLFEKIHATHAKVVLLLFPFLNNDHVLRQSADYMDKIVRTFHSICTPGDALIDVTSLALSLGENERVVGALDAHPSPMLHSAIAEVLFSHLHSSSNGQAIVKVCSK